MKPNSLMTSVMAKTAKLKTPVARAALARFRREEDGSLLIFGLFCFVMMLALCGIALDLVRFEERRTLLQNTIDRASLAAADLQQTLPPKDVVKDYFRKAGLTPPRDEDIIVTEGQFHDSRRVEVTMSETMPTWFMKMKGLDVHYLTTQASSTAEESIGQVEISLVLDVSGSMNSNNRLNNLIPAAKDFVDHMFNSAEAGKISISIIPYATQVSLGPNLISYFNVTNEHAMSHCIEFDAADFTTTAVRFTPGPANVYQRNGHFDPFYNDTSLRLPNCSTETGRYVIPFSGDRIALKTFIDGLQAGGNTSIDIGMKWATALLDPSTQGIVDGMIAKGQIPSAFADRPYSYSDKDVLKVIVLMTDGENTTEYRLRDSHDHGVSLLSRNSYYSAGSTDRNQYSLWDETRHQYYIFALDKWRDEPWGDGQYQVCGKRSCTTYNDTGYDGVHKKAMQMTWQEVWATMTMTYFSDNIIYKAHGSSSMRNAWRPSSTSNPVANTYVSSTKDALTKSMCDEAKSDDKKIRIFTIAFEAPTRGQNLLRDCASADSNYYAVTGLKINDAFAGIVNSINKLRLTH